MIQAVMEHPVSKEPLYLCTWQQDFSELYYQPSWVCSTVLLELSYGKLIVDFYERQVNAAYPTIIPNSINEEE